jgi:hypothetical protein
VENPLICVGKIISFDGSRRIAAVVDLLTGAKYEDVIIASSAMASNGTGNLYVPAAGATCIYYRHPSIGTIIIGFIPDIQNLETFSAKELDFPSSPPPNSQVLVTKSGAHIALIDGAEARMGVGAHGFIKFSFWGDLFERAVNIFRSWFGGYEKGEIGGSGKVRWKKAVYARKPDPSSAAANILGNSKDDGVYFEYNEDTGLEIEIIGDMPIKFKINGTPIGVFEETGLMVTGNLSII